MLKLAVGLPAYRSTISSMQAKMWIQLGAHAARLKDQDKLDLVMIGNVDVCGVDRARNILMSYALKHGADWLLMVDSDTWAAGGALIDMVMGASEQDCALVGAAVRQSGSGLLNVARWNGQEHAPIPYDEFKLMSNRFVHVDAIGGAIIAVNLRQLNPDLSFKWLHREDGSSMSEDYYFCRRLRERGKTVLVDRKVSTWHVDKPHVLDLFT